MTQQRMGEAALDRLTKPWEEFVGYPYDDKVPKRRNAQGRLAYPVWNGGPRRGTITVGFGHTDAAGPGLDFGPKIVPGMTLSEAEACELLLRDMAPCERQVRGWLKVPVTQHEYEGLVDTDFNCPSAALAACRLINAGNMAAVPGKLMQYTYSKGEHMAGLDHRRAAEIAWMRTPDEVEGPSPPHPDAIFSPKGEREPAPRSMISSKTGSAAATIGAGGVLTAIQSANDAAEPIKQAQQNLTDLGLMDRLALLTHAPAFAVIVGVAIVALAAFVWWDRHYKMTNDHI